MNVSDIATRVKTQFGDTDGSQIADADIVRWVNDAQKEIVLEAELMQARSTANVVASQADYSLATINASILRVIGVKFKDSGGTSRTLTPISLREAMELFEGVDNTITSVPVGTPTHYSIWAGNITLYPNPQFAVTGGLIVYYLKRPAEVTIGDTPELPVEFHNRIVEYALAQAAELDDNLNLADRKMAQFNEGVEKLKDFGERPVIDAYPSITFVDDISYGGYHG